MSDSVDELVIKLEDLSAEARSEKVTVRNKAIDQIKQMFDCSLNSLQNILSGATRSTLKPTEILLNVFDGMFKHASRQEQTQTQRMDNKAQHFSSIIQHLINFSNQLDPNRISAAVILDKFLVIFEDTFYAQQYGSSYLKVLLQYLTKPAVANFTGVDKAVWKRLLNVCQYFFERNGDLSKNVILQCMLVIIEIGTKYSFLVDVLVDIVPFVESLLASDKSAVDCQNEAIRISLVLCKSLSVSYQYEMCLFTETISGAVMRSYKPNMADDVKSSLFNLLEIMLIVHEPKGLVGQNKGISYSVKEWDAIKASLVDIVNKEIVFLNEYKFTRDSDAIQNSFITFASYLYYLLIHDEDRDSRNSADEDGPTPKRIHRTTSIERILDKIQSSSKINWRWFVVLGQILETTPAVVIDKERHVGNLITLCATLFPSLTYDIQLRAFYNVYRYLIRHSDDKDALKTVTNQVLNVTLKTKSAAAMETLKLTIINDLLTVDQLMDIFRNIIAVPVQETNLRVLNLLLKDVYLREKIGREMAMIDLIIKYLNSNSYLLLGKNYYNSAIDYVLLLLHAELNGATDDQKVNFGCEFTDFDTFTEQLNRRLSFKAIKVTKQTDQRQGKMAERQLRPLNKSSISILQKLFKTILIDPKSIQDLNNVKELQVMVRQLQFTATFFNRLQKVFQIPMETDFFMHVLGKCRGNMETIANTLTSQVTEDKHQIAKLLEYIHDFLNQDIIKDLQKIAIDTGCVKQVAIWCRHQIKPTIADNDELVIHTNDPNVYLKSNDVFISVHALEVIIFLSHFDEKVVAEYWIPQEIISYVNIVMTFKILKTISQQRSPNRKLIAVVVNELKQICGKYHKHQLISLGVVDLLIQLIDTLRCHPQTLSQFEVFIKAFILISCKEKHSPQLTFRLIAFYEQLFEKLFSSQKLHPELFDLVIDSLSLFLNATNYEIKLRATEAIIKICNIDSLLANGVRDRFKESLEYTHYTVTLFSNLDLSKILAKFEPKENDRMLDKDEEQNHVSVAVQLCSGLILSNHILAEHIIYLLFNFYYINEMKERRMSGVIPTEFNEAVEANLANVLDKWTSKRLPISSIPYFLTSQSSIDGFCKERGSLVGKYLLKNGTWTEFTRLDKSIAKELKPMIVIYSILCEMRKENDSRFKSNLSQLNGGSDLSKLSTKFRNVILKELFVNLWDPEAFKQLFRFPYPEMDPKECDINERNLKLCLDYYARESKLGHNALIIELCTKHSSCMIEMLCYLKGEIISTKEYFIKLKHLYRYMALIDLIVMSINAINADENGTIYLELFTKDLILFLLAFLTRESGMAKHIKMIILGKLRTYVEATFTTAISFYQNYLNEIISMLIDLIMDNREQADLSANVVDLIQYFVIDNVQYFDEVLDKIDIFPSNIGSLFDKLRKIQQMYQKGSLKLEIERFLATPHRRAESIKYLRAEIIDNAKEFACLFDELMQRPRMESIEGSLVHKLIHRLLEMTQSERIEVGVEASKLLGDIGPVDLTTIIFRHTNNHFHILKSLSTFSDAIECAITEMVKSVLRLIHCYQPAVSCLAAAVIPILLQQTEAEYVLKSQPQLAVFQRPMRETGGLFKNPSKCSIKEVEAVFAVNGYSKQTPQQWTIEVVEKMLKILSNHDLVAIIKEKESLANLMMPLLFRILLSTHNDNILQGLTKGINKFFEKYYDEMVKSNSNHILYSNKNVLKSMLNVVELIRIFNQNIKSTWELNYLPIAHAAHNCDLYANAILLGELWAEAQMNVLNCAEADIPLTELRDIMIACYEKIEAPDAVKPFLDLTKSRQKYYLLENAWEFAYLEATSPIRSPTTITPGIFQTEVDYEVVWRLCDWKLLDNLSSNKSIVNNEPEHSFQMDHCLAIKGLSTGDEYHSQLSLEKARQSVIKLLGDCNWDCTKNVYKYLLMLHQITQIEDVTTVKNNWQTIATKWKAFDQYQLNNFEQQEQILGQRISILRSITKASKPASALDELLKENILQLIAVAKDERKYKVAISNLKLLESMELSVDMRAQMILNDGHLHFIAGHSEMAKHLFLKLINDSKYQDTFGKISALRLLAEYLTGNMMGNPNEILKNYLAPAEKHFNAYVDKHGITAGGRAIAEEQIRILDTTAKFTDTIYTQRNNYLKSSEYADKERLHNQSKNEFQAIDKTNLTQQDKLRLHTLRQTVVLERVQLKSINSERENFLKLAVKLYTKSCTLSSNLNDLQVCRIVSLWFTNIENVAITEFLQDNLGNVPSYKFLVILPQIAARLDYSNGQFTKLIADTLIRCCVDHPFHCVQHILALNNAYEDNANAQISSSVETRINNTRAIMRQLLNNPKVHKIVKTSQNLSLALIKLANLEVKDAKNTTISNADPLLQLKDLHSLHLPTKELSVRVDGKYDQLISIVSWVKKFEMVGGINCPKKLTIKCSDGMTRSMLVKGKDDMRQDAVMQQVFHFMNILLKSKKCSLKRNLRIRTYKIVPLTQMSGILEFCDNTTTLGNYLVAAHKRYRPEDMPVEECRKIMSDCAKKTADEKAQSFQQVCGRLKPVFQHFFTESFLSPVDWFERRLYYINSVATTSMVGYILGIGDRHVNNILIDKSSAEVIHIDFGIAFERGKLLPTPEQVPFRLTRDVVAAMGCFGVDGIYKKSCEITMEVLRENKAVINTIVEVFLYDPLYSWMSNNKRSSMTGDQVSNEDSAGDKNALAARVLIRINEKLNGRDENDATTIENQVERLIRQAMNPLNLAQMFYGWQPYL